MIYSDKNLRLVVKCADLMGYLRPSWSNKWNGLWGHYIYCEYQKSRSSFDYNPITEEKQCAELEEALMEKGVKIFKSSDRVIITYQDKDYAWQPCLTDEDRRFAIVEFAANFNEIEVKQFRQPEQRLHFNRLSPSQAERLACLIEECGEVVQAAGKILRHGYDSEGYNNRDSLETEVSDLLSVIDLMVNKKDLLRKKLDEKKKLSTRKRTRYLHHNK